jgi:hypothetical protein
VGDETFDALAMAALLGILAVAIVAIVDILADGNLDPTLMALLTAVLAPLVPALIVRFNRK